MKLKSSIRILAAVCALVFCSAPLLAQQPSQETQSPAEPQAQYGCVAQGQRPPTASAAAVHWKAMRAYSALRRGRQEFVALIMPVLSYAHMCVGAPRSRGSTVIPLQLDLRSLVGVTIARIKYPKTRRREFHFATAKISVVGLNEDEPILVKLKAARHAPLGNQTLLATLSYQVIGDSGIGPVQHAQLQIPISVVGHNAPVQRNVDFFYRYSRSFLSLVGDIILFPFVVFAMVVGGG